MRKILWLVILSMMLTSIQVIAEKRPNHWIEASLEVSQVYVQAQAIYRLRFYQSVALQDLQMKPPVARLAEIVPIGERQVFEKELSGNRYRVNEQLYSVSPLVSGALHISGAQVSAKIPGQTQKSLNWSAKQLTLTVLPVPATENYRNWLPATDVELTEQWFIPDEKSKQVTATRQIKIKAIGIHATQIPELFMTIPGMLVIPKPPMRENIVELNQIVGVLTQKFLLYPLSENELTAPAIPLVWWNTQTKSAEVAQLPMRSLWFKQAPSQLNEKTVTPSAQISVWHKETKQAQNSDLMLVYVLVLTLTFLVVLRLQLQPASFYHWWPVFRASFSGDARQISNALLTWVQVLWPQSAPQTINALASILDDAKAQQFLLKLDRELYGPESKNSNEKPLVVPIYKVKQSVLRVRKNLSG